MRMLTHLSFIDYVPTAMKYSSCLNQLQGLDDEQVLEIANREGATLITCDKDHGELVFLQGLANHGVLLIRLSRLLPSTQADHVSRAVREHGPKMLNSFTVIGYSSVRIRGSRS